jgi:hypothetical protein
LELLDITLLIAVLLIFYVLSLIATKIVFSNGDGIDTRRMLIIAPLAPITFYSALTVSWMTKDGLLSLLIFAFLFYVSLRVIKWQSSNPGYTMSAASKVFFAILWRVILLGFAVRAATELSGQLLLSLS